MKFESMESRVLLAADPFSQAFVVDSNRDLFEVDLDTGGTRHLGATPVTMFDLAQDGNGQLFGVTGGGSLYRVARDGTSTLVGNAGTFVNALGFREDGRLFAAGGDRLYEIDPNTGASSFVMTLPGNSSGDLTFDDSSNLFLTASSGDLIRVNAGLSSASVVGSTGISDLFGIVYETDGFLYGLRSSNESIYRVDPDTAATGLVTDLLDTPGLLNGINGAAGNLGSCCTAPESDIWISDSNRDLFRVDVTTGGTALAGVTPVTMFDLAQDGNGQLFGVSGNGQLYRVAGNGASTPIGSPGAGVNALEFRADGRLFGAGGNTLYEINPNDGTRTSVLTLPGTSSGDLAFDDARNLYVTTTAGTLVRVNAGLTSAVVVGSTGVSDMFGLIYQDDGFLYGIQSSTLDVHRIDFGTGASSVVSTLTNTAGRLQGVYGATGNQFLFGTDCHEDDNTYVSDLNGDLFLADVTTGGALHLGNMQVTMFDIAKDRNGRLFGTDSSGRIYRIDTNAATTLVGSSGVFLNSLGFRADGRLFGAGGNQLYEIDPLTGSATALLTLPGTSSGDLTFDASNNLYVTTTSAALIRVDANVTSAVTVGSTGISNLYGLVYEDGSLFGIHTNRDIYRINIATAGSTLAGTLVGNQLDEVAGAAGSDWVTCCDKDDSTFLSDSGGDLFRVDIETGGTQLLGNTGVTMFDLAQDGSGDLFGISGSGQLYRIGLSGAIQPIGSPGAGVNALEFRRDGRLFAAGGNRLYEVNPIDGTRTVMLTMPGSSSGDLAFDASSNLYVTTTTGQLVRVNAGLTSAVVVGSTGISDLFGLVAQPDGNLYAFRSSNESLYRVDSDTAATSLVTTLLDGPNRIDGVFGATGVVIDCCNDDDGDTYVSDSTRDLFLADPRTGGALFVGNMGVKMFDLAQDADGRLFGVSNNSRLYRISPSGTATLVGPVGQNVNALEFRADGRLFAASGNRIVEIDPNTGAGTVVLNMPGNSSGDLTFDSASNLYVTATNGNLIRANASLTSAVVVGTTGVTGLYGLTPGDGLLFGMRSNRAVYEIDPYTGASTATVTLADSGGLLNNVFGATGPLVDACSCTAQLGETFVNDADGDLFVADLGTGGTLLVGNMGVDMFDLARDGNGQLWGISGGGQLYRISPSAAVTPVGSPGPFVNSLEFRADGRLIGAGSNQLYDIDTNTGARTALLTLPAGAAGDLTFDAANNLFMTAGSGALVRVTPGLDAAANIGSTGIADLYGLVSGADGFLYAMQNSTQRVFRINRFTAASSFVTTLSNPAMNGLFGATSSSHLCFCNCAEPLRTSREVKPVREQMFAELAGNNQGGSVTAVEAVIEPVEIGPTKDAHAAVFADFALFGKRENGAAGRHGDLLIEALT